MTKQDFVFIANILKIVYMSPHTYTAGEIINLFSDSLRAANVRFDETKFKKACYGKH